LDFQKYDANVVFQKMLEDVEFSSQTPEGAPRQVFRDMLDQLPEVIGDQMDALVTPTSLMQTGLRVLRHHVATNFVERLIRSFPDDHPSFLVFGKESMVEMVSGLFPALVTTLEGIVPDVPGFIASQGITDEIFLGHPQAAGLDAASMASYRAGTLTIAGLLMTQPKVVLDFSNKKKR